MRKVEHELTKCFKVEGFNSEQVVWNKIGHNNHLDSPNTSVFFIPVIKAENENQRPKQSSFYSHQDSQNISLLPQTPFLNHTTNDSPNLNIGISLTPLVSTSSLTSNFFDITPDHHFTRKRKMLSGKKDTKSQCTVISPSDDIMFKIIPGATQRGRPMLLDSHGYTYNLKKVKPDEIIWRCSVRNKYVECSSIILQDKKKVYSDDASKYTPNPVPYTFHGVTNSFSIVDHYLNSYPWLFVVDPRDVWYKGPAMHIHPQPKQSSLEKLKLTAQVKQIAQNGNVQSSAYILNPLNTIHIPFPLNYQMTPLISTILPCNANMDKSFPLHGPSQTILSSQESNWTLLPNVIADPSHNGMRDTTQTPSHFDPNLVDGYNAFRSSVTELTNGDSNNVSTPWESQKEFMPPLKKILPPKRPCKDGRIKTLSFTPSPSVKSFNNNIVAQQTNADITTSTPPKISLGNNVLASFQNSPFFEDGDDLGYYSYKPKNSNK